MLTIHRGLSSAFTTLLIAASLTAAAQSNPADNCNTVDVSPLPAASDQTQTVHVRRYCPNTSPFLAEVNVEVQGNLVRVDTQCTQNPLLLFSCQIGSAELPNLDTGIYALEVYALENNAFLFEDEFRVGVTAVVPAMNRWGIGLMLIVLCALGGAALLRQPGRSRLSNKRS